jgi:hypothetical protein
MQPTISILHGWDYPRFTFGQLTKQGIIIGMVYYQTGTYLAEEFGEGWYYTVSPNKHSELTLLSPEESLARIQAEIDCYRQQIKSLTQQLSLVSGGRINAQVC